MKNLFLTKTRWLVTIILLTALGIGNAWGDTKTFTPTNFNGQGSSSGGSITYTNTPITVSSSKGYGYSTGQTRIINGGTLVVSCTSGYTISGIALTFTSTKYQGGLSTSYTGLSTTSWTSPATTADARISKIVVTYSAAASCTTIPTVNAASNSSVTTTTATVSCSSGISVLGSDGCSISSYGFVIGKSSNPEIGGSGVTQHEVGTTYTSTGVSFSKELTGLTASTTYYVRPYATNGKGTAYGTQTSFTTSALPKYTVTLKDDGDTRTQASAGASVTLPAREGCAGYTFAGWTKTWVAPQESWTTTAPTIIPAGSYTPTANENLYPVYTKTEGGGGPTTESYGFEEESPTNWTIGSQPSRSNSNAHSGSYAGYINTNHTYVTFKEKVKVTAFSFWLKRTSTNSKYNVYIETSTNGTDWSAAATYPMSDFGNGTYTQKEMTWDGSTAYYVRFHCYNTTATRYVDDISITYSGGSTTSYISVPNCCTPLGSVNGSI